MPCSIYIYLFRHNYLSQVPSTFIALHSEYTVCGFMHMMAAEGKMATVDADDVSYNSVILFHDL